ncbi:hypothetical protein SRHO_G00311690 [Serrasalmus rhombeus]
MQGLEFTKNRFLMISVWQLLPFPHLSHSAQSAISLPDSLFHFTLTKPHWHTHIQPGGAGQPKKNENNSRRTFILFIHNNRYRYKLIPQESSFRLSFLLERTLAPEA